MDRLIICAALTGCVHQKCHNPALPITPEQIAEDARQCANEGATVFHVHPRDILGNPVGYHQIVIQAVRDAVPGAVVSGTCSGRHFKSYSERSSVLMNGNLPDMASLAMGSVNHPMGTSITAPSMIEALANRMNEQRVRPEAECFELGHVDYLNHLLDKRLLNWGNKPWVSLFLGNLGSFIPKGPWDLQLMADRIPRELPWAASGIGRWSSTVPMWAVALGGHVRVGLEDSLWMDADKEELATNPALVARVASVGRVLGREPATFEDVAWMRRKED